MSLHPQACFSIPEETQRVARAAFPKSTLGLRIAEELGLLYSDAQFADLFPTRGQPAASPARLALASVLPFVEGLSATARPPTPSAPASTGSTPWGWNGPIPVSITPC